MKQFHDANVFNTRLPSFVIPKITVYSLTHETRIKDAVNMDDLVCLLATVRALKSITRLCFLIKQDKHPQRQ